MWPALVWTLRIRDALLRAVTGMAASVLVVLR
jgi:hypothetical protein